MSKRTQFAATPELTELDQVPRELRFFPSDCSQPGALSGEQIDAFNCQGFVRRMRIFDASEMVEQRAYFDRLLDQVRAAGGDSYSISTAHLKYSRVYDLLTEPRIVACVKDLLGENVVGWGSHYFCKLPHDGKSVDWHQDASYWPLTPSKTVTVWLAIDDADRQNACMRFVPTSHRHGHLEFRTSSDGEGNVLNQTVERAERFGNPVDVELRAGEISLHSDLLLHGSDANQSDRRRCGLTLRYCAADVRAYLDWRLKGVLVSGTDPAGHWANPPRPQDD